MNSYPTSWTTKELGLIHHTEIFQAKPAILKKVEIRLIALKKSLEKEIKPLSASLPKNLNLTKSQIARGENHNGFPYLSLDYPQNFSKTEMFTFRTLFWWGHYLGFALILKGNNLKTYTDRLLEVRSTKPYRDIYVSLAPAPWEWEINEKNFSLVSEKQTTDWQKTIAALDYLKIIRVFPVTDENFMALDWTQAGLNFWKDLTPVTLK
jgi:hypothetical protein